MHIEQPPMLLGLSLGAASLVFNKREREAMRRASAIADAARSLLVERYGIEVVEASELDMTLASVEHDAAGFHEAGAWSLYGIDAS